MKKATIKIFGPQLFGELTGTLLSIKKTFQNIKEGKFDIETFQKHIYLNKKTRGDVHSVKQIKEYIQNDFIKYYSIHTFDNDKVIYLVNEADDGAEGRFLDFELFIRDVLISLYPKYVEAGLYFDDMPPYLTTYKDNVKIIGMVKAEFSLISKDNDDINSMIDNIMEDDNDEDEEDDE